MKEVTYCDIGLKGAFIRQSVPGYILYTQSLKKSKIGEANHDPWQYASSCNEWHQPQKDLWLADDMSEKGIKRDDTPTWEAPSFKVRYASAPQMTEANTATYGIWNRFNFKNIDGAWLSRASPWRVREAKNVQEFPELKADVRIYMQRHKSRLLE